jgi:hypothetical protein
MATDIQKSVRPITVRRRLPHHGAVASIAGEQSGTGGNVEYRYRRFGNAPARDPAGVE